MTSPLPSTHGGAPPYIRENLVDLPEVREWIAQSPGSEGSNIGRSS